MFLRTAVAHQASPGSGSRPAPIPMDAWRETDRLVIALDLPGVAAEAVEIEAHGRMITIRAERRPAPRGQSARTRRAERTHGLFERRIQLADGLDAARLQAHLGDGVLTLTVPVAQAARRRKIAVHGADQRQTERQRQTEPSQDAATPVAA
ncbi:Hsp20/alpha crystallin family protein [Streptacidiphilus neutrinimicus]|uniref:Hsp20/alpha crystallin family protein n=1 Tax=Streptacidiphilus neutrinimicus TaxID=105420 RepID=UPI0005A7DF10|nr:Hsp20/alpha crystallin family protein [Streptacidiphilus neutrinimicus]